MSGPATPVPPDDATRLGARVVTRIVAYIAGPSPTGRRTVDVLREMTDHLPDVVLDLDVVDVLENPDRAELDRILATPTVIRINPLPRVRLVGDLSVPGQRSEVLHLLFDR